MSQNSNAPLTSQTVLGSGRAYPLPRIHNSIGQNVNGSSRSGRRSSGCRCRLGLGVNEKTGRLQWCPGFTCCKLLIVLPVVMLPLTLVLILLMRMDGMLLALRMQRQQLQQLQESGAQRPAYVDDYIGGEALADMLSEQLILPIATTTNSNSNGPGGSQDEAERIRRCMSFKFGLSEGVDVEERDLMKDSRTSFLPQDTTALPRDCLDALGYGSSRLSTSFDDYNNAEEYLRRRLRRASRNNYRFYRSLNLTERRLSPVALDTDDAAADENDAAILEGDQFEQLSGASKDSDDMNIASLQAFWNEEGTKESMRQAQANTMLKYMDPNVNPCNDFYKYACGNWEKLHPIPKDKAGFDTFEMLRENLDAVLKQLLESNDDDPPPSSASKKNKVVHISGNNYEQEEPTNADRVALAEVASPTKEERPEESRIVHIRRTAGDSNEETAKAEGDAKSDDEATRLRKHIVSRREALSQLLRRYRRDATSTIRKRLTAASPVAPPKASLKPPQAAKAQGAKVPNLAQRKARHLYQSCTNSRLLAKRGIQPLLSLIDNLGGWPVLSPDWNGQSFDWLNLTAQLRRYNNDILIVQWVGPDIKNSDENVIQFDQTSLGLPTREYFLQDVNAKYLQAYQRFMSEVMHKLGAPHDVALRTAAELIAFETQLAAITSPAEQRLNVTKLYKRMTLRQLHDVVPAIDWQRYLNILQQRQVQDSEEIVIYAVDYMHDLVALLAESRPSTVANYLLWRFVRHRINNVDDRFEDIKQNFYHALFGREESPSRWKVCIAQVNTNMGMALGSMFVTKYFDENSKRDTLRMTHELQQAFREILKTTDWLDPNTKHLAELKVNAMSLKIGYPDFILNPAELNEKYAGIEIHPEKYFENTLNVLLHTAKTEQSKLHEMVNKTAWQTAPAIVNAYYSRNKNQIMFPAGILQPPFYHRHFPRSLNFGGIGVVIGHELTHGFDDKGRLFDRNGSIHKWWTDSSIRGFDERARCIIAQYSNYTVGEVGIALNGESTQGENIADNGGIRQAFHAYKRWLQENPNSAADERLPGINMTGEQLFFLNFGQVWCGAMRPEAVRNKLNTAIHSPGRFRVIGTLSNSKDFAREFQCPLGSPMNPEQKCSVW